jgi:hypothetical protein
MAVRPVPLRFSDVFNSNNYFKSGEYLSSFGDQRLVGRLTTNGSNTYGDEVVHGDETIYGQSETTSEPLVTNISALNDLTDHHLVTKYTANYMTTHLSTEPTITTLTANNSLQNNQLVSKKYVDEKITESSSANLYPTRLIYGKSYTEGINAYNSLDIQNSLVYVKFQSMAYRIYTCVFNINYHINRSPPNGFEDTWFGNSKSSIYTSSTYLVNWFYNGSIWLPRTTFYLLDGQAIHNQTSFEGIGYKPVTFGLQNNVPSISIGFPESFDNVTTREGWISNFGISIQMTSSQSDVLGQTLVNNDDMGIGYFSNNV